MSLTLTLCSEYTQIIILLLLVDDHDDMASIGMQLPHGTIIASPLGGGGSDCRSLFRIFRSGQKDPTTTLENTHCMNRIFPSRFLYHLEGIMMLVALEGQGEEDIFSRGASFVINGGSSSLWWCLPFMLCIVVLLSYLRSSLIVLALPHRGILSLPIRCRESGFGWRGRLLLLLLA